MTNYLFRTRGGRLAVRVTCASDKRTSRGRKSISGLITRGVLGLNEGWIWLV